MTLAHGPEDARPEFVEVSRPLPTSPVGIDRPVQVVAPPVPAGHVRTATASRFAPDSMVSAIVGLIALLVGLLAIVRAGIDGPMSDPVVSVAGFNHTATLGMIDTAFGLALLLAGAARSRSSALFFGSALGVAGFIGAVQAHSFTKSLAIEPAWGWIAVVGGVIVVLSALMLPRVARSTATYRQI